MSVKLRLKEYLKSIKLSERAFGDTIGVSSGYVSGMRQSIQPDKIESIAIHYPNLNTGWLLTGQGEMLNDNPNEGTILEKKVIEIKSNPKDAEIIELQRQIIKDRDNTIKDRDNTIKDKIKIIELQEDKITSLEGPQKGDVVSVKGVVKKEAQG